jgi:hypothetical protein
MKKINFASMLAVAAGLAVAACSQPAETAATEADAMSVEEAADEVAEAADEAADEVAAEAEMAEDAMAGEMAEGEMAEMPEGE